MSNPKVTILISAYNEENYLQDTIECLRAQTYKNWEGIFVDDCSADKTQEILEKYAAIDPRIHVIRNEKNLRLPASLNKGLEYADGKYVVRMDADDICTPDRIEKQVEFMEKNPETDMSFCKIYYWENGEVYPVALSRRMDAESIKALLLFTCPIFHNAVIFRTEAIKRIKYNPEYTVAEDLELWTRMAGSGMKITAQEGCRVFYRLHGEQTSVKYSSAQREQYRSLIQNFYRKIGFGLQENALDFLEKGIYFGEEFELKKFHKFMKHIKDRNRRLKVFDKNALNYAAFEILIRQIPKTLSKPVRLRILLEFFSPAFIASEWIRRRWRFQREVLICEKVAKEIGMVRTGTREGERTPVYYLDRLEREEKKHG